VKGQIRTNCRDERRFGATALLVDDRNPPSEHDSPLWRTRSIGWQPLGTRFQRRRSRRRCEYAFPSITVSLNPYSSGIGVSMANGRWARLASLWCQNPSPLGAYPFASWIALVRAGTISVRSPTAPRSATSKIGASGSLLIAMMKFEPFMPTRCWIAPEIPAAM